MASESVFTKIIRGDLPARFIWRDDHVVAFLAKAPLSPGHTLVVPRQPVDHWIDLEPEILQHLMAVAQQVARGLQRAFRPTKVGLMIAGLEVRHVHVHLSPIKRLRDLVFSHQQSHPDPAAQDDAAVRIRAALRAQGHTVVVAE